MTGKVKAARLYKEHVIQRQLDAAERLMWELEEEEGDADLEPTLGAPESADQRRWSQGSTDEREVVCEDEGAQCEDEGAQNEREPEPGDCVPEYHPDDQRRIVSGGWGERVIYSEV